MTLAGMLTRYAIIYIALMALLSFAANAIGLKSGSALNVGGIAAAVLGSVYWFSSKNGRALTRPETNIAWAVMVLVDLALQVAILLLLLPSSGGNASAALLLAIAFVGIFHAMGVRFFLFFGTKIWRDAEKARAAKAASSTGGGG
ncbi:MAG: ABZJ_00895 family protein [Burkholderiaceae bacterium]